jgi:hypothetical protein
MSSSLPNARLIKGWRLELSSPRVLPCPECGKLAMKRVRGPCTLRDGTVLPELERLQCNNCRANFFDDNAMWAVAEFRRRSSHKARAAGRR